MIHATVVDRIRLALLTIVLAAAAIALLQNGQEISASIGALPARAICVAALSSLLSPVCALQAWRVVLHGLGTRLPLAPASGIFYVGQLGKYVPGSIWSVVTQAELGARFGVRRRQLGVLGIIVLALTLLTGSLLGLPAVPAIVDGTGTSLAVGLLTAIALMLVVLSPPVLNRTIDLILRVLRQPPLTRRLGLFTIVAAAAWLGGAWLTSAATVWILVTSTAPPGTATARLAFVALSGACLATIAGMLSFLVPAGLGVREALLIVLLAPMIPVPTASAVVVVSRALAVGSDVLWALAGWAFARRRANPGTPDADGDGARVGPEAEQQHNVPRGAGLAPGGMVLSGLKRMAELAMWARVAVQHRVERVNGRRRPRPGLVGPTGVLRTQAEWRQAVEEARSLHLPLHPDRPKNWDALGAVGAVLALIGDRASTARVLDAGSARYSPVLPWLRLYGLGAAPGNLVGINLEFGREVLREGVAYRYGDITDTEFPDASMDAVTCLSVIEHGVPVPAFLQEAARILRRGGVLCLSTDYDQDPPDTSGLQAYGVPVRVFGPSDVRELIRLAKEAGLELIGDIDTPEALAHTDRPVHWRRAQLDYTFILLTFRRI